MYQDIAMIATKAFIVDKWEHKSLPSVSINAAIETDQLLTIDD